MLISLLLLVVIALGGIALTYLVADDEAFSWRVAAGSIAGSSLFGLVAFVAACLFGFSSATVFASMAVSLLPLLLLRRPDIRSRFERDWAKAKGSFEGMSGKKFLRFVYYTLFFFVFWFFLDRAVYELKDGLYTGGSQNFGDLPFHLGAIFSFTEGNNFPPQNPSWAGAKFSYPFMADFLTACFVKLGVDFKSVMVTQNIAWAMALLIIIERFAAMLTNNKLAGKIAPALLFFSGGLGFLWFFSDVSGHAKGFFDFIWHLPRDYTIRDEFRWGNPMVVLFITQRGLLFGMPLTILVIGFLWRIFTTREADTANHEITETKKQRRARAKANREGTIFSNPLLAPFLVGLLAGTLPLVHLHSLVTLFIISAFLLAIRPAKWRDWVAFGVGTAVIAVPELFWSITGTATETTKFFGWHFGWDKRDLNFFWFWFKNTGLVFPALAAGIYLLWRKIKRSKTEDGDVKKTVDNVPDAKSLLLFYIPFAFLFALTNVVKLAPWEWDNIKILIYWLIGSIPLIAYALAWCWQQRKGWEYVAGVCLIIFTLSGAIDIWRTASGQIGYKVFELDAMKLAEQLKLKTDKGALFLNGPTFNPAVVLAGRQSLMRYSGHLGSYGIDYGPREADVKQIYLGGPNADGLLKKHNIDYVAVTPYERTDLKANEEYFKKFPIFAESGVFKVYKVKN